MDLILELYGRFPMIIKVTPCCWYACVIFAKCKGWLRMRFYQTHTFSIIVFWSSQKVVQVHNRGMMSWYVSRTNLFSILKRFSGSNSRWGNHNTSITTDHRMILSILLHTSSLDLLSGLIKIDWRTVVRHIIAAGKSTLLHPYIINLRSRSSLRAVVLSCVLGTCYTMI